MHISTPRTFSLLLALALVAGCSKAASDASGAGASTAAPPVAAAPDGPCALLTNAEVRHVFPDAKGGVRDHSVDQYGIAACLWDSPHGRFSVQLRAVDNDSVATVAHGTMNGFVDPVRPNADASVRYETIKGIGDGAVAVIERGDEARGILSDIALLVTQHNGRRMILMSTGLALRDRAEALDSLTKLGRAAGKRL